MFVCAALKIVVLYQLTQLSWRLGKTVSSTSSDEGAPADQTAAFEPWRNITTRQKGFRVYRADGPVTVEVNGLPEHLMLSVLACDDSHTPTGWPFGVGQPFLRGRVGDPDFTGFAEVVGVSDGNLTLDFGSASLTTGLLIGAVPRDRGACPETAWGEIELRFIQGGRELGVITGADVPDTFDAAVLVQVRSTVQEWFVRPYTVVGPRVRPLLSMPQG